MSLNVLLITFSFPPAGGVGVLRALSLAKYLPENDVRVDVLTARNAPSVGKDPALLAQVPTEVLVHRSWTADLPFALRKAVKRLVSGGGKASAAQGSDQRVERRGLGGLLKRTASDLLLPDPQVGWLPFAFPAARRIVRERRIDVVLITVPPFSCTLLVAKLRSAFPSLPLVLDFRDEWLSTTINLVSFSATDRAKAVARQAEADAVRDATAVVAVTEAARREMMSRYPKEDLAKFVYLPNGFDAAMNLVATPHPNPFSTKKRVVITYLGSVYRSTEPMTFVEAVLGLPPALRERLLIRFIGHIEGEEFREALLRLGPTVELKGFVPQADALRAMRDTDLLLLITRDRVNVSAKFYDYLSSGKPILAAVHAEGDARRLMEETKAGWWADVADAAAIRTLLAAILSDESISFAPDITRIASFERRAVAARYASLLHSIAARST